MANSKPYDPTDGAVAEGVGRLYGHIQDFKLPGVPGKRRVTQKEQYSRFLDMLPDLVKGGPKAQAVDAEHGPGAAAEYLAEMTRELQQGRERRSP